MDSSKQGHYNKGTLFMSELDPAALPETPPAGLIASAEEIPDKLFFRIGDVAKLAGIKPYVLRFWESEFPQLGPKKSGTGQRLYRRKDVQLVFEIKTLLYEKRFTIEGARKHLDAKAAPLGKRTKAKKAPRAQTGLFDTPAPELDVVRKELRAILKMLH
jgi:DNA-binding transcriptional MerR regulator